MRKFSLILFLLLNFVLVACNKIENEDVELIYDDFSTLEFVQNQRYNILLDFNEFVIIDNKDYIIYFDGFDFKEVDGEDILRFNYSFENWYDDLDLKFVISEIYLDGNKLEIEVIQEVNSGDVFESYFLFEDIKILNKNISESDFNEFKFIFDVYNIKTSERILNLPLRICPFGGCET